MDSFNIYRFEPVTPRPDITPILVLATNSLKANDTLKTTIEGYGWQDLSEYCLTQVTPATDGMYLLVNV